MKRVLILIGLIVLWSCDDIIEVPDISSETVAVLAPTDGAALTTTSVTFNWSSVEDVDNYRIQIATPSFANAEQLLTDSLTTDTNFDITLQSGEYEWRIRAENSDYQTAYTTQSFSIEE